MSAFPPDAVRAHLFALGCNPAHVEESFTHAGGPGGQNVNKVATCVQLRYPARNLQVRMQEHRTQGANRAAAWRRLAQLLQQVRDDEAAQRRSAREQARRRNSRRPAGVRRAFVEIKRRRAKTRQGRSGPNPDE